MTYFIRLSDHQFPLHIGDVEVYMSDHGGMGNVGQHFAEVEFVIPPSVEIEKMARMLPPKMIDGKWTFQWEVVDKPAHILEVDKQRLLPQEDPRGLHKSGSEPDVID